MNNKKVFIASSRDVGGLCLDWAKNNLPEDVLLVENMDDCDILISVLYDKILSSEFLDNRLCFNFHPGILPNYRGSGAYSWSLINNEKIAGITLHLIDSGIDTGDVIEIRSFPILEEDTAYSLCVQGEVVIYEMFKHWFRRLLIGDYVATPQNADEGTLYLRKDLDKAKDLTRYIKAFTFPDKESAYYIDKDGKKIYLGEML